MKYPAIALNNEFLSGIFTVMNNNTLTARINLFDQVFVENTIIKQMERNQLRMPEDYLQLIQNDDAERKALIGALYIGYTEFFRNPLTFATLEQLVFPSIINKPENGRPKEIRIWSAACATGQEAYSLAMLLEELKESAKANFTYRIFATDASAELIEKAAIGFYTESEIQNMTLKRIIRWLQPQAKNTFLVRQELKSKIEFSVFDLLDASLSCPPSSIFGDFDLVFCANLLFYYKKDIQQRILGRTIRCVNEPGYFVCGEVERDIINKLGLSELVSHSAVFKVKICQ